MPATGPAESPPPADDRRPAPPPSPGPSPAPAPSAAGAAQRTGTRRSPGRRWRAWLGRAGIGAGVLLAVLVAAGGVLYAATPSVADAPSRVAALASRNGATLLPGPVPPQFARALVASEDSRFYAVPGIDPIAVARAAWMVVTEPGADPGGSTLSQQLAKQLYTGGSSGWRNDLIQLPLAVKLNVDFSKAQILRMYADTVYFGHGFYGLVDAACGYFGVRPAALSLAQASLLAGLVQAPSAYDPLRHLPLARSRQQYVLGQLVDNGTITPAQSRAATAAPLHLADHGSAGCPPPGGLAAPANAAAALDVSPWP